jgi:TfoX N-terminal domain
MAYDEEFAERVREIVQTERGVSEKRMFGGLTFMINGHMAVSVSRLGGLLLRVEPAQTHELLTQPHTQPFEMRGREMDGWLRVEPGGVQTEAELERWVGIGVGYANALPPKT